MTKRFLLALPLIGLLTAFSAQSFSAVVKTRGPEFQISFPTSVHSTPVTGRVFLFISRNEPRERHAPMFGIDVDGLEPGSVARIDAGVLGYPVKSLRDLPPGEYFVQALLNVYTQVHRADGHTLWVHFDQGEGQRPERSPGNLYSEVRQLHVDPQAASSPIRLQLTKVIPPLEPPADTEWVKHIRIQSALLTRFWGHPMYLGATILLPKGYAEHPETYYPVIYLQDHFSTLPPFGFSTDPSRTHGCKPLSVREGQKLNVADPAKNCDDSGMPESAVEFYQSWSGEHFPRMIAVTFQHATPYYDDSYAVNSVNTGPYGDAVMTELIPAIEQQFRIIRAPYARLLTGVSTGGWIALALQIYHPEFFGGAWSFAPDPVDLHHYESVNLYDDENAFSIKDGDWLTYQRYDSRTSEGQPQNTIRDISRRDQVFGSHGRSGRDFNNWEAVWGPTDTEGYPKPLWDRSGKIDHEVANYMREHGYDLQVYLERHWREIGLQLVGKLHLICGDEDDFFLNLAVYELEDFLENTDNPYYAGSFEYGRPMRGHGWAPTTNAELIRRMAKQVVEHAPMDRNSALWNY